MFPLFSKIEKQVDALRAVVVNTVKYVGLIVYPINPAVTQRPEKLIYSTISPFIR